LENLGRRSADLLPARAALEQFPRPAPASVILSEAKDLTNWPKFRFGNTERNS
jgi:hypothetical protein